MNRVVSSWLLSGVVASLVAQDFKVSNTAEFRQALIDAKGNGESDVITLVPGLYSTTVAGNVGFEFEDNESFDLTIQGESGIDLALTTLSGNQTHRVLKLSAEENSNAEINFSVKNLTIANGKISENYAKGGGIYTNRNLNISNVKFANNQAYYSGSYQDSSGGAIYGDKNISIKISNSKFTENKATSRDYFARGGAIFISNGSKLQVLNTVFSKNKAYACNNNSNKEARGGAIYTLNSTLLEIANSSFIENQVTQDSYHTTKGGAIYSRNTNIINSLFSGNSSDFGKDIYLVNDSSLYNNFLDRNNVYSDYYLNFLENTFEANQSFSENGFPEANSTSSIVDKGANPDTYLFQVLADPEWFISKLNIDIQCNDRIVGDQIDIGAFEIGGEDTESCTKSKYDIYPIDYTSKKVDFVPLSVGWNLVAIDMNLSDISEDIEIVWQFHDGNWSAFSPQSEFMSIINSQNIALSNNLSSSDGTWFLSNSNSELVVRTSENNDSSPSFPNLDGKLGWNLMGVSSAIPPQALSCDEGEVTRVWKYRDENWYLWLPNVEPSQYPNMFSVIGSNEGFWLQCK
jgi:hypothetical protein